MRSADAFSAGVNLGDSGLLNDDNSKFVLELELVKKLSGVLGRRSDFVLDLDWSDLARTLFCSKELE